MLVLPDEEIEMRPTAFAAWLTIAFIVALVAAATVRAWPEVRRRWDAERARRARELARAREELESIQRELDAAVAEEAAQRARFRETLARAHRSALPERLRTQPKVCGAEHGAVQCWRASGHEMPHRGIQRWERDKGGWIWGSVLEWTDEAPEPVTVVCAPTEIAHAEVLR